MTSARLSLPHRLFAVLVLVLICCAASPTAAAPFGRPSSGGVWAWPVAGLIQITEPYRQPAHAYADGHRGIDIRAPVSSRVLSPADGVVAFVGTVVDRSLITIDHGNGFVSTLEPVSSQLRSGKRVARGDVVGTVATGGHTANGSVHWGVRHRGEYLNPATLLGGVSRPVLLPCCQARG